MIPFDAPFVPEEPGERLRADGSRDCAGLIEEHVDAAGVTHYEVNF